MPLRDTETRHVTLVDIPLVRRLADDCTVLDSEMCFTRDVTGPNGTLISSILLPQRGWHTLISRSDTDQVVGQFRLRHDEPHAHIVYVAPGLDYQADTAWLHVLDAMAREAGRQGAHAIIAEVNENEPLFETMRNAGYAVYARQEVWQRLPDHVMTYTNAVELREATADDEFEVQSLLTSTVPSLVQQYAAPPSDMDGLVYRPVERIEAYIAVAEGRHGVYMIPYLHPDTMSVAPAIFRAALRQIDRARKVPVYVSVRRYQDWIVEALAETGFHPITNQAVMVKHITAGVRHATFRSLESQLERVPSAAKPPTLSGVVVIGG